MNCSNIPLEFLFWTALSHPAGLVNPIAIEIFCSFLARLPMRTSNAVTIRLWFGGYSSGRRRMYFSRTISQACE